MTEDRHGETSDWGAWVPEPRRSRFEKGRFGPSRWLRNSEPVKERRPGRLFTVFKALVLLILFGISAYGLLSRDGYLEINWLPLSISVMVLVFITLFVRRFYADVPRFGWWMMLAFGLLVGIKALSLQWTINEVDTITEVARSSTYAAFFLLALGALSSERQVAPVMDIAILVVVAVAGYGLMQKISPIQYPVLSLDGVRVDSTLGYSNTTAAVLGMGVMLALSRITSSKNFLPRIVHSAFVLALLAALYMTVSRGGIGSVLIALIALVVLTERRLQTVFNILIISGPLAWVLWRTRDLEGLFVRTVPDEQKLAAGASLRQDLIIALVAVILLQLIYTLLVRRYELMPLGKKIVGFGLAGAITIAAAAATTFAVLRLGGVANTVTTLTDNPALTRNSTDRLASLSIGLREEYWSVAWSYWMDHFFTGSGAGAYNLVWARYRPLEAGVQQVHNVYLEQGVETGIVGFLALAVFVLGVTFFAGRAARRSSGMRRILLCGLLTANLVYSVSSIIEWHWYIPSATIFYFILTGIMIKYAAYPEWSETPRTTSSTDAGEDPDKTRNFGETTSREPYPT